MPLREDLLNPIPGPNPSGQSLRGDPVYDKIKEARRVEEAVTEGELVREGKRADYATVVRLAGEALASQSKDLQLAAWLIEALLCQEHLPVLRPCLEMLRGMLETFWDTLYPELEDGDTETRAMPLNFLNPLLAAALGKTYLSSNRLDYASYKLSRNIPKEEDLANDPEGLKAKDRKHAEEKGIPTPEEFETAVKATGAGYYKQLLQNAGEALESVESLDGLCREKFAYKDDRGRDQYHVDFAGLRKALEEFRQTIRSLLFLKGVKEEVKQPEPAPEESIAPPPPEAEGETQPVEEEQPAEAPAAAPVRKRQAVARTQLASREDAIARVADAARFLRGEDPYSPAGYLLPRALRWGELRAGGASPDSSLLESPPTEVRQQLKQLAADGQWQELLDAAETAAGEPCGRAWLDLQRYAVRACRELEYTAAADAICSELKGLLADYPELPKWSLTDDTPAANAETQEWLEQIAPARQELAPLVSWEAPEPAAAAEPGEPGPYPRALEAASEGRLRDAIQILAGDAGREDSGRGRFQHKIRMAEICIAAGQEAVAYPILQALAGEIEQRRLEEWEAPGLLAHVLALLLRCLATLDGESEEKKTTYARICRLDPMQALTCPR